LGGQKTFKIPHDLGQLLTFTANISRTGRCIQNRKQTSLRAIPAALNKKFGELWSTNKKVIGADVDPP